MTEENAKEIVIVLTQEQAAHTLLAATAGLMAGLYPGSPSLLDPRLVLEDVLAVCEIINSAMGNPPVENSLFGSTEELTRFVKQLKADAKREIKEESSNN